MLQSLLVPQSATTPDPNSDTNLIFHSSSSSSMHSKRPPPTTTTASVSFHRLDDDPSSSGLLKRRRPSSALPLDNPSLLISADNQNKTTPEENNEGDVADQLDTSLPVDTESTGLRLLGLLFQCVAMDNLDYASNLLPEIAELSSPYSSSAERVAAYFADALSARIITSYLGTYSPSHHQIPRPIPPSEALQHSPGLS